MTRHFLLPLLLTALPVSAATLIEDFSYSGVLSGKGTAGGGWAGAWGAAGNATGRITTNSASNLTYSGGGYAISQTGNGYTFGDFGVDFRGINRSISATLTGTVWFSILINSNAATNHVGVTLNNNGSGADYLVGTNYAVDLTGSTLRLLHGTNTVVSDSLAGNFALGTTHLLLGRIDLGAGVDTISLWMNPSDLTNISNITPNIVSSAVDIGSSLTKFGVFSYSSSSSTGSFGQLDALRISDGNGDATAAFQAVTGVPEAGTSALLLCGLTAAGLRRRRP